MRKNDGRLIAVMALAAVLSFLFINMTQKGTHKELVIQKDRAVIKRVDLGKVTADTTLPIAGSRNRERPLPASRKRCF